MSSIQSKRPVFDVLHVTCSLGYTAAQERTQIVYTGVSDGEPMMVRGLLDDFLPNITCQSQSRRRGLIIRHALLHILCIKAHTAGRSKKVLKVSDGEPTYI